MWPGEACSRRALVWPQTLAMPQGRHMFCRVLQPAALLCLQHRTAAAANTNRNHDRNCGAAPLLAMHETTTTTATTAAATATAATTVRGGISVVVVAAAATPVACASPRKRGQDAWPESSAAHTDAVSRRTLKICRKMR